MKWIGTVSHGSKGGGERFFIGVLARSGSFPDFRVEATLAHEHRENT